MKNYLKYIVLGISLLAVSCKNNSEKEKTATTDAPQNIGTEKVAKKEDFSDMSIYNLPSVWTTQDGSEIKMEDLQGKVLAMVMIYTSCQAACPRLVADMRNIEKQIPDDKQDNVQYVFVSIDPKTDTPKRLREFAKENQMEDDKWLFLRGTEEDTREFAAVLAVNYKAISPIDFSHSNIISVFNKKGELVHQQEGLGVDNKETIKAIKDFATN
ncbi:SCO family protein [Marixanthomonas spongiae]|uniref:SCO family protein n=1 Tax=Marixanthomonas spongiae TaxID=2174845 RepID=A0A2U0I401_9FLAO|nr:SCO family protein [Marixanthomonas spongiae]PVW15818.1 SCO family protein [Marixanthomonas spongiae]